MAHSVFTIVANIIPERLGRLETVLAAIQAAIEKNDHDIPYVHFRTKGKLHFASFVVFDRESPPAFLVFENSVDDSRGEYLNQLMADEAGVDAIYENCVDYPGGSTRGEKRAYLEKCVRKPHLYHIGTAYRLARYIQTDRVLRRNLEMRLDALMNPSLRTLLEAKLPVLPGPPSSPGFRKLIKVIVTVAVTALLMALAILSFWARHPWIASFLALLCLAGGVSSLGTDRARDRRLSALLGATAQTGSPTLLWRQLQREFPADRYPEPRALERIKNWALMLWVVPVATVIIRSLWDEHLWLLGFVALAFGLKSLWLSILVGWPTPKGRWKPVRFFVPLATIAGAIIGLWPWRPAVAPFIAYVFLAAVALVAIVRLLPTRRARQTRGNWVILPFVVLAAALGWLSLVAGRVVWSSFGLGGLLLSPPGWLRVGLEGIVALVVFTAAFIALVFLSAVPGPSFGLFKVPYVRLASGIGAGALVFWAFSNVRCLTPWPGAFALAVISLVGLFSLWAIPLPMPSMEIPPISRDKLRELTAQEDKQLQNHMATMVRIRTDWQLARAALLVLFLRTLNRIFYRTVVPDLWYHSTLFGIPTIHFAQWTVLDRKNHMFLSNYDLSWTGYLDDFGTQLTTGIQKIWGQSEENPGVTNIGRFKEFVRTQMVPYQVWYSAYPGLSAAQIHNNEQIRLGLLRNDVDEETSVELLRRLMGVERS